MTDEMLVLARENQKKAGVENMKFLKGHIEDIPLPDEHVDVVISNSASSTSPRTSPRRSPRPSGSSSPAAGSPSRMRSS